MSTAAAESPITNETDRSSSPGDAARVRRAFAAPGMADHRVQGRFTPRKLARESRALGSLVTRLEAGRRLDVGCGTGTLGAVIAAGACLYGVDGSPDMAGAAAQRSEYEATVVADATRLPFVDGGFDSAVSIRLLHHLDESSRRRVLSELRRVVTGGVVVSFFDAWTLEAWRASRKRAARGSRRAIPVGKLRADAVAAGWRIAAIARKSWRITEHVYVLLEPIGGPARDS